MMITFNESVLSATFIVPGPIAEWASVGYNIVNTGIRRIVDPSPTGEWGMVLDHTLWKYDNRRKSILVR